jgi:hypothetical protein
MPFKDPNICSMHLCDMPLGPNSLEFTHKGKPAGGICTTCVGDSQKIRVLFKKNQEGVLEAIESQGLD